MMTFDEISLKDQLETLSSNKQLLFGLTLCERMMPLMRRFASTSGISGALYDRCIDLAWSRACGESASVNYAELAEKCLESAPDTEDYIDEFTSPALDAALSTAEIMSFLNDNDVAHIVRIAGLARDTVTLKASSLIRVGPVSPSLRARSEHPLVQRELRLQAGDLKAVQSIPSPVTRKTVQEIRERALLADDMLSL